MGAPAGKMACPICGAFHDRTFVLKGLGRDPDWRPGYHISYEGEGMSAKLMLRRNRDNDDPESPELLPFTGWAASAPGTGHSDNNKEIDMDPESVNETVCIADVVTVEMAVDHLRNHALNIECDISILCEKLAAVLGEAPPAPDLQVVDATTYACPLAGAIGALGAHLAGQRRRPAQIIGGIGL